MSEPAVRRASRMAEGVGFEPTRVFPPSGFQDRPDSQVPCTPPRPLYVKIDAARARGGIQRATVSGPMRSSRSVMAPMVRRSTVYSGRICLVFRSKGARMIESP